MKEFILITLCLAIMMTLVQASGGDDVRIFGITNMTTFGFMPEDWEFKSWEPA